MPKYINNTFTSFYMVSNNISSGAHNHDHNHDNTNGSKDLIAEAYDLLKSSKPVRGPHTGHTDHEPNVSIRQIKYKDHDIVIRTRYEIEVDGKVLNNHIYVDNEGKVSSHAMPTYSFPSTVDLIKRLIDKFPNSFSNQNIDPEKDLQ